jgi:hypothetical protein
VALLLAGASLGSSPALAQEADTQACLDAHGGGQVARSEGRLKDARNLFIKCASPSCPGMVRQDCAPWVGEVDRLIPSVLLSARTSKRDVVDVTVSMDGSLIASRIDGKSIEVDPGEHVFRFEHPDYPPVEQRVVVREGEKGRSVAAELIRPGEKEENAPTPPPISYVEEPGPVHWSAYLFGGLAATGLGVFVGFGAKGLGDRSELEDTCRPFCTDDQTATMRTSFIAADVGWITAAVASAATVTVILLRPTIRRPAGGAPPQGAAVTSVVVAPVPEPAQGRGPAGGMIGIGGVF